MPLWHILHGSLSQCGQLSPSLLQSKHKKIFNVNLKFHTVLYLVRRSLLGIKHFCLCFTISAFREEDSPCFYNSVIIYIILSLDYALNFIPWKCKMAWVVAHLRTQCKLCVYPLFTQISRDARWLFFSNCNVAQLFNSSSLPRWTKRKNFAWLLSNILFPFISKLTSYYCVFSPEAWKVLCLEECALNFNKLKLL